MKVIETKGTDFLPIKRVVYGNEKTPIEDREFVIIGVSSCPVGTVNDWKTFAKEKGYRGLKIFQNDGSVDFVFIDEDKDGFEMRCQECGGKITNENDCYGHDCEVI